MGVWAAGNLASANSQLDLLHRQLADYEIRHQRAVRNGRKHYSEMLLWRHYITMAFHNIYSDIVEDNLDDLQFAIDLDGLYTS